MGKVRFDHYYVKRALEVPVRRAIALYGTRMKTSYEEVVERTFGLPMDVVQKLARLKKAADAGLIVPPIGLTLFRLNPFPLRISFQEDAKAKGGDCPLVYYACAEETSYAILRQQPDLLLLAQALKATLSFIACVDDFRVLAYISPELLSVLKAGDVRNTMLGTFEALEDNKPKIRPPVSLELRPLVPIIQSYADVYNKLVIAPDVPEQRCSVVVDGYIREFHTYW